MESQASPRQPGMGQCLANGSVHSRVQPGKEEGREGGRERGREREQEGREGGREGGRDILWHSQHTIYPCTHTHVHE